MLDTVRFLGLDCLLLKNEAVELLVSQSAGPRLIRLSLSGGPNLMAELPDTEIDCPGFGSLKIWGGHRLWHAPEAMPRTYLPDNRPLAVREIDRGVEVTQPTEGPTGLQKSLRVILPDGSATVVIDHTLKNEGLWNVELAPWAITQLKAGGTAILPQFTGKMDAGGLLPNRRLALWSYTDINSPHIRWGNRLIFIEAAMPAGDLKIGWPNPAGWLAYYLDGTLFVKQAAYYPEATYLDHGSSSECYCRAEFIELETLGPQTNLAPGETVTHRETWRLYPDVALELNEAAAETALQKLGLVI